MSGSGNALGGVAGREHLDLQLAPAGRAIAGRVERAQAVLGIAVVHRLAASRAEHLDRLGVFLDRHRELGQQVEVLLRVATQRGQVVADDHRVDAADHALAGAEVTEG